LIRNQPATAKGCLKVLQGEPLQASDKFSFDLPPITSANDWQNLVAKTLAEAELFAAEIEKLDEAKLFADFADPQYGNYYRNIAGIIEHVHYHLGQISLIKKILNETEANHKSYRERRNLSELNIAEKGK